MDFWKRLKNLWKLSGYKLDEEVIFGNNSLQKNRYFMGLGKPPIKSKMATIIPEESINIFEKERNEADQ